MNQPRHIPIGIIGMGNNFDAYAIGLARFSERVTLTYVADVDQARAEGAAVKYAVKRHTDADWRVIEHVRPSLGGDDIHSQTLRSLGVLDLITSLENSTPHRTNAPLAYHTLEVPESIQRSSDTSTAIQLASTCERPAPLGKEELAGWNAPPGGRKELASCSP